uniref:7TM_GPCR_Srx domain-containing protein n=1 Tax=Heterorhabditis bacteriophora TaxID=37862 RepID=A0A1I7XI74_HETBA
MTITVFNFTKEDFVVNQLWYTVAMQIGGIITAPVNFSGILVILFCATNELKGYRWHLLVYQICCTCSDIMLNFGVFPTVYSPFPAGSVDGFLFSVFNVDKLAQVVG